MAGSLSNVQQELLRCRSKHDCSLHSIASKQHFIPEVHIEGGGGGGNVLWGNKFQW